MEEFDLPLTFDFKAAYIPQGVESEYADDTQIYLQNDMFDLFYYEQDTFCIQDSLHELSCLEFPSNPVHSQDCKGLCGVCGQNLNSGNCEHKN